MDKIEKLLRKIAEEDRQGLLSLVERLASGETKGLLIKRITDSDLYRLRSGRFRVILHYEGREVIIDSIKLRNESTYTRR